MSISAEFLELLKSGEAIIIRLDTFVDLQKRLEALLCASAASVILNEAGRECRRRSILRFMERTQLEGAELLKSLAQYKKEERWGEFDFSGLDWKNKKGSVVVKNSFEAKKYGPTTVPVCHFLRGYISEVLSVIFKQDMFFEENLCLARKDPHCEFSVRTIISY